LEAVFDKYINLIQSISPLEQWEVDLIRKNVRFQSICKNTIVRQPGSWVKELYFINKGCLRAYYLDKSGRECTRAISFENTYCWAINFINELVIHEYIEALADSVVIIFPKENFYFLVNSCPGYKNVYMVALQKMALVYTSRIETLLMLDARERYNNLLLTRPEVILNLSNKVVASFLGITEQSLSRIKASK
jgi:CRP-like cAMP-binding protein